MKVVIVGGGTAGWITAIQALHFIKSKTKKKIELTVIDSSKIEIIGAGEGSTGIFTDWVETKLAYFGKNELDFLNETGATLKLGINFKDWDGVGTSYLSPIEPTITAQYTPDVLLLTALLKGNVEDSTEIGWMMRNGYSTYHTSKLHSTGGHALHFDAHKVGQFLKSVAIENGTNHIDAEIKKLNRNPINGELDSVLLDDGSTLDADFWIDCSGFARVLIKPMGGGWRDFSKYLPVNRALPYLYNYKSDDDIRAETVAWAQKNGWMWQIPTQERYGCGYVYCDYFTTADKAFEEMKLATNRPDIEPIRELKFDVGCVEQPWVKNVLAIGLSSGFLEPLQATSIHTTLAQSQLFFDFIFLEEKEYFVNEGNRKLYNQRVLNLQEDFRDLLQFHYMGKRDDSDFWKFIHNDLEKTQMTKNLIEISKYRAPSFMDFYNYFGAAAWGVWGWTLVGLGYVNKFNAELTLRNARPDDVKMGEKTFEGLKTAHKINSIRLLKNNDFINLLREGKIKGCERK
jgi:flavin-dependent dehydrogenase